MYNKWKKVYKFPDKRVCDDFFFVQKSQLSRAQSGIVS